MLGSTYIILGWIVRLVMIPIVARRHRPYVALAWLAPIFLVPVLGTLLYVWLNVSGLQRNARKHRRVRREVESDDELREQREHRAAPGLGPDQRALVRLGERLSTRELGGFPILSGNALEALHAPGETVDRLITDIDEARYHVHLLFYLYVDDPTGRRVAEALARAVRRGVRCRVLVDAWASRGMLRTLAPELEREGVRVHSALTLHPLRRPLARVDIRNHRKLAVLDGRIAYTGSTNLHEPDHALEEGIWHQVSVRLRGPAVLQLQMLFVEDWYFATDELLRGRDVFPPAERVGDALVQTMPGGPSYQTKILQHVLVQAAGEADERLTITTPYLVPDEGLLLALQLAALRGVRVDVALPRRSDRPIADSAGRAFFAALMRAGVRIHLHPSGILHAKTLTVDDEVALIGSANLDRRSMSLNYELMLLVYDVPFLQRLRAIQTRFLEQSVPIDPDAWAERPAAHQLRDHTAKLLSPIL